MCRMYIFYQKKSILHKCPNFFAGPNKLTPLAEDNNSLAQVRPHNSTLTHCASNNIDSRFDPELIACRNGKELEPGELLAAAYHAVAV